MFRSLVGRALFPVGVAVTGFVIVCCLLLYSAIRSGVNRDAVLNATNMADTILKSTRYAMLKSDRETLATVIHNIGEQKGVEHVRIFSKKGVVNFSAKAEELNHQVDKSAEGCNACHSGAVPLTSLGSMKQARTFTNSNGKSVMAITTPIYNEPDCFNAACHVHQPGQKILGTLDVGLSQEALNTSLALIRTQMIIFTLMTLVLTLGGVTALLRRSVFLPIQQLLTFVDKSVPAKENIALPSHLPDDLNRIATGCQTLVQKLHQAEQERDALAQKTAAKE
jgi:sensor histidine kinase regulating citrate/malate metabolism